MEILRNEFGQKVVSLGFNCFPASYIKTFDPKETSFFDYMGSSMKGIVDAIDNDFEGFFELSIFEERAINERYKFRYFHEFGKISTFDGQNINEIKDKKLRQIQRFKDSLDNCGIFIRYDSNNIFNNGDDLVWLKEFSKRVKTPKFIIIFLSEKYHNTFISEFRILILCFNKNSINWQNCNINIKNVIDGRKTFILRLHDNICS